MRRALVIMIVTLLAGGVVATAMDGNTYGDGVKLENAVQIKALLATPDKYVGQMVRVEGVISAVCQKRGCWMQITDPDSGEGVRIKVEDGVIVFPYSAMGHKAAAEGVFTAIPVEGGEHAEHAKAEAAKAEAAKTEATAEGKEPCDKTEEGKKAGCDAPKKGNVIYLIQGTGAVIEA